LSKDGFEKRNALEIARQYLTAENTVDLLKFRMSAYYFKERILDYKGKLLMLPDVYS
jgi:hypothetical protein